MALSTELQQLLKFIIIVSVLWFLVNLHVAHCNIYPFCASFLQLYYRQKGGRAVTRPQAIHETFEQCADVVVTKLQSYYQQADDYHNQCLQGEILSDIHFYGQVLMKRMIEKTPTSLAITSVSMLST